MSGAARAANQMRFQAALTAGLIGKPKSGLVSSYDGANHAAKVRFMPEDVESGFLPIITALAGQGWGIQAAPSLEDQALVVFEEGDRENGWIIGFVYSDDDRPFKLTAGEVRVAHKKGAILYFTDDGKVSLTVPEGLDVVGDVRVDGDITSTGDMKAEGDVKADGDVKSGDISLPDHHHAAPGGNTGPALV